MLELILNLTYPFYIISFFIKEYPVILLLLFIIFIEINDFPCFSQISSYLVNYTTKSKFFFKLKEKLLIPLSDLILNSDFFT